MGELSLGLRRKKKNKKKQTKLKFNVSILENNPGNISDIPDWWWKWWWWCQRWQKKVARSQVWWQWSRVSSGGQYVRTSSSGGGTLRSSWESFRILIVEIGQEKQQWWSLRMLVGELLGSHDDDCVGCIMVIPTLVLVKFTWIICDDFNQSDDDCDCSVIGDCAGSTWCSILSMSIGGCATPSKGIGDFLRKPSSQLLKDQPRHQTSALLTIKLLHLPLVHLLHQVIFFLAIKRKRRYVVMMWLPHFTWWNSTLEKNTTWLLHCWRNTPPACNNTLVFNFHIVVLLSTPFLKPDETGSLQEVKY